MKIWKIYTYGPSKGMEAYYRCSLQVASINKAQKLTKRSTSEEYGIQLASGILEYLQGLESTTSTFKRFKTFLWLCEKTTKRSANAINGWRTTRTLGLPGDSPDAPNCDGPKTVAFQGFAVRAREWHFKKSARRLACVLLCVRSGGVHVPALRVLCLLDDRHCSAPCDTKYIQTRHTDCSRAYGGSIRLSTALANKQQLTRAWSPIKTMH